MYKENKMPSSTSQLRKRFMLNGNDGIAEAEKILRESGWTMDKGMITKPEKISSLNHSEDDQKAALEFLIWEWDYDLV